jgi:putative ABC transport system substrate-binding protein
VWVTASRVTKLAYLPHPFAQAPHDLQAPSVAVGFVALEELIVGTPVHTLRFIREVVARVWIVRVQSPEFIALLGGAAAWSWPATAQHSEGLRRIGMLLPGSTLTHGRYIAAFRQGLRELGYTEGRHFSLDVALAEGRLDRLPSLAAELAALKVDVIVTGSDEGTLAARQATTSIPIVQGGGGDLVRLGMAQSLAHPGANVTGLNNEASDLSAKLLEMLMLMVPTVSQIGVLTNPTAPQTQSQIVNILEAGRALHVAAHIIAASERAALDDAFGALLREHLGALVVIRNALFVSNSRRIVELAASARLPVIYPFRSFVEEGGLMS